MQEHSIEIQYNTISGHQCAIGNSISRIHRKKEKSGNPIMKAIARSIENGASVEFSDNTYIIRGPEDTFLTIGSLVAKPSKYTPSAFTYMAYDEYAYYGYNCSAFDLGCLGHVACAIYDTTFPADFPSECSGYIVPSTESEVYDPTLWNFWSETIMATGPALTENPSGGKDFDWEGNPVDVDFEDWTDGDKTWYTDEIAFVSGDSIKMYSQHGFPWLVIGCGSMPRSSYPSMNAYSLTTRIDDEEMGIMELGTSLFMDNPFGAGCSAHFLRTQVDKYEDEEHPDETFIVEHRNPLEQPPPATPMFDTNEIKGPGIMVAPFLMNLQSGSNSETEEDSTPEHQKWRTHYYEPYHEIHMAWVFYGDENTKIKYIAGDKTYTISQSHQRHTYDETRTYEYEHWNYTSYFTDKYEGDIIYSILCVEEE